MTAFFEVFNPGARHWREQKELEKQLVIDATRAGPGHPPVDLDSGRVTIYLPADGSGDTELAHGSDG